ncbi:MAG TPA: hypothetical protein EYN66_07625, partial [Myxococcales bacterium]|nr:hypothetical protein [Myxococcales bacterium]
MTCDPNTWHPGAVGETLTPQELKALPAPLQAIVSGKRWHMTEVNECGDSRDAPSLPLTLTWTLDDMQLGYLPYGSTGMRPLNTHLASALRALLLDISARHDIHFVERTGVNASAANIRLRESIGIMKTSGGGTIGGYANYPHPSGFGMVTFMDGYLPQSMDYGRILRHELGHQLFGLKHPFEASQSTGVTLPIENWPEDSRSTDMSYTVIDGGAWNTRYAPLDESSISRLVDLDAPAASHHTPHTEDVDTHWGVGAIGFSVASNHTLRLHSSQRVMATLRNGPGDTSAVPFYAGIPQGQSAIFRLGPNTDISNVDIRDTDGGVVEGNDIDNEIWGSNAGDVMVPGLGQSTIHFGTGNDALL